MSLKRELNKSKEEAVKEHALKICEEYKQKFVESAREGYTGFTIPLEERDDAHILRQPIFLEQLSKHLDGCVASIETTEHVNLIINRKYRKYHLSITW